MSKIPSWVIMLGVTCVFAVLGVLAIVIGA